MNDLELAEVLEDLLRGFGPAYTWTVRPIDTGNGLSTGGFQIDLTSRKHRLSWMMSRRSVDDSRLSLWDQAKMLAERMMREVGSV